MTMSDRPLLHDYVLNGDVREWWACKHPERPFDMQEVFDERCRGCRIKAQADLVNHGDVTLFDPKDHPYGTRPQKYMLSDLAAGRVPWSS